MEHYGLGILFVERACTFKTKEENGFLLKPTILIGTDILTECPRQVLESKYLAFIDQAYYYYKVWLTLLVILFDETFR